MAFNYTWNNTAESHCIPANPSSWGSNAWRTYGLSVKLKIMDT